MPNTLEFIINFAGFFLLNSITLTSAVLCVLLLMEYKVNDWKKFILSVGVCFFSLVFLSEFITGMVGLLSFTSVLIINTLFLILVFIYIRPHIKEIIFPKIPKAWTKATWFSLILFAPFIFIVLIRHFNALFQIPLEYDSVTYHLPFAVEWLKTGNLWQVYYSAFAGPLGHYPSNFELFALWSYFPFNKDYFVNLINLPVIPLLGVSIYAVARNLKIDTIMALLVTGLFLYMPQIFRQLGVPLVDLFFAFSFMAAIYFLQEFIQTKSMKDLFLMGLAAGLFIGTKYLGIPYLLPLLFIGFIAIGHIYKWNVRSISKGVAFIVAGLLMTGGFWYIRNWVVAGNPLFPMEIKLFGMRIFEGYYGLSEKVLGYSLDQNVKDWSGLQEFLEAYFHMVGAPGFLIVIALMLLMGIGVVYGLKYLFAKNNKKEMLKKTGVLLLPMIAAYLFYFYWRSPFTYTNVVSNIRYAMMFLLIGCLAVGVLTQHLKKFKYLLYALAILSILYNIVFLIFTSSPHIVNNDKMLIDYNIVWQYKWHALLVVSIIATLGCTYWISTKLTKNKLLALIPGALSLVLIVSLFLTTLPERENLRTYYINFWYKADTAKIPIITSSTEAALWFDENAPNANIAYTGFNFMYHFFGRSLQREVNYVNINECLQCRYHDYKASKESIRRHPNYEHWMQNLQAFQKDYLVVAPHATDGVKSWEYEWAQSHPDNFQQVFENKDVYIYKIIY